MSGGLWFTSDLHLGHKLVAKLRGFGEEENSTAFHDAALAARWDALVRTGDTVWVLGDLTLGQPLPALQWVAERPGIKHLVLGNHDAIFPGHRGAQKDFRRHCDAYAQTFHSIQTFARIRILGEDTLLSHFPYPGTSEGTDPNGRPYDDRYAQYRLPDMGLPIVHGHTHRGTVISLTPRGTPQIHVGLDAWNLSPVSLAQVEDKLLEAHQHRTGSVDFRDH